MLPRRLRLQRQDFPEARGAKRASSAHFSVSYSEGGETAGTAIVVSKKVARLSVSRHLLKRRLMPVVRPYAAEKRLLIIHVRPGAGGVPSPELRNELNSLLRSILPAPTL